MFYIPLGVLDLEPAPRRVSGGGLVLFEGSACLALDLGEVPFTVFMEFLTLVFWTLDMLVSAVPPGSMQQDWLAPLFAQKR